MKRIISLFSLLFAAIFMTGCITVSLPDSELRQVTIEPGDGFSPDKIAIIEVAGVLSDSGSGDGFFSRDGSIVDLAKKLSMAEKDSKIKAVVLRLNTPGGGVTASDIMYHEIKKFREESEKPVYVSMQTVAASGGYYIAMASDRIYATPTTITGSIGVIATFPEIDGLMNRFGVEMNAITSGDNKDAGAFYKQMDPDERQIFQSLVDDMYGQFVQVIQANRTDLTTDQISEAADGRVYTANQALELGLIDEIMYLDEVLEDIEDREGLDEPEVIIIRRGSGPRGETVYAASPKPTTVNLMSIEIDRWQAMNNREVFNYLWIP